VGLPTGEPLGRVAAGSLPYVVLMILGVALLALFPGLALWLPAKMF
jgi:C4-dicarboxylate transporter DctM subunit